MSSGRFLRAFYTLNNGEKAAIRVQPETGALVLNGVTNTIPAGPATWPVRARVSGSRRGLGTFARTVSVRFGPTSAPEGYVPGGTITLAWFNPTTWEALPPDAPGTYLGADVTLAWKTSEKIK